MVLRASSLDAVTNFVWSTKPNPSASAFFRTACRIRTISSELRNSIESDSRTLILALHGVRHSLFEHEHPLLYIQGSPNPLERKTQFDQSDRDRRLHSHDHGLCIQQPGHSGNAA